MLRWATSDGTLSGTTLLAERSRLSSLVSRLSSLVSRLSSLVSQIIVEVAVVSAKLVETRALRVPGITVVLSRAHKPSLAFGTSAAVALCAVLSCCHVRACCPPASCSGGLRTVGSFVS